MSVPASPPANSGTPTKELTVDELADLARGNARYRGKAIFELIDRAPADTAAAERLAELSEVPKLREDRVFHMVSMAWAAIIGLLVTEKPYERQLAYDAFAKLGPKDQENLLRYLRCGRIEEAHPPGV